MTSKEDILSQFIGGAEQLEAAIAGLSEAELNFHSAEGGWSIRQIVHHVADDGDAWSMALKKAIATPGAPIRFEGFPGNEPWADALEFDRRGIGGSLGLIRAHRVVMADLAHYFAGAWEDGCIAIVDGTGTEVQRVSVGQIIAMLGGHMLEHVQTIEAIKQEHGL